MQPASEIWSLTIPTLKDNLIARKNFRPDQQPKSQPSQPQQPENDPECEEETPRCTTCRYVKSRTCGSKIPGLSCKKPPPVALPSIASLSHSVSANCRYCCCTLCEFFKETHKCIQGDPKSRICDVLADLSDIFLAILTDCVLFIRRIGCTVTCVVLRRSHRYTALVKDKLVHKIKRSKSLSFIGDRLKTPSDLDESKSKTSTVPSESKGRKTSTIHGDRSKSSDPGRKSKTRFIQGDRSKTWFIPEDEGPVDGKIPSIRKSLRKILGSKFSKMIAPNDEAITSSASDDGSATEDRKTEQKKTCCETKKCKRLKCCLRRYLK